MTVYEVDRFLRRLSIDPEFRALAQTDFEAACNEAGLGVVERELIAAGDVGELFASGVTAFLLHHLLRFGICGITLPQFTASIRRQSWPLNADGRRAT